MWQPWIVSCVRAPHGVLTRIRDSHALSRHFHEFSIRRTDSTQLYCVNMWHISVNYPFIRSRYIRCELEKVDDANKLYKLLKYVCTLIILRILLLCYCYLFMSWENHALERMGWVLQKTSGDMLLYYSGFYQRLLSYLKEWPMSFHIERPMSFNIEWTMPFFKEWFVSFLM